MKGIGEAAKGWEGFARACGMALVYSVMTVHGMGLLSVRLSCCTHVIQKYLRTRVRAQTCAPSQKRIGARTRNMSNSFVLHQSRKRAWASSRMHAHETQQPMRAGTQMCTKPLTVPTHYLSSHTHAGLPYCAQHRPPSLRPCLSCIACTPRLVYGRRQSCPTRMEIFPCHRAGASSCALHLSVQCTF